MNECIRVLNAARSKLYAGMINNTLRKSEINFEITCVNTKEDFNNILKDFKYDIVFSDDEVTGLNGYDIIGELKRAKRDCYFIILTPLNTEKGRLINYEEDTDKAHN